MRYFFILLLFFSLRLSASPFADLQKREYKLSAQARPTELNRTQLWFDAKHFTEINKPRDKLPKDHPLYMDDSKGAGGEDLVLGIVDLTGHGDSYYVTLSDFPSYDIAYAFYKNGNKGVTTEAPAVVPDFTIAAPSVIIPSNGLLYSYGHNNNSHSIKNKYEFSAGKLTKLSQPFMYVGAAAKSLKDQTIFSDLALSSPLYKISKGSPVTIVGLINNADKIKEYFIVASEFGLVGYVENDHSQTESQFTGFYFNGD